MKIIKLFDDFHLMLLQELQNFIDLLPFVSNVGKIPLAFVNLVFVCLELYVFIDVNIELI